MGTLTWLLLTATPKQPPVLSPAAYTLPSCDTTKVVRAPPTIWTGCSLASPTLGVGLRTYSTPRGVTAHWGELQYTGGSYSTLGGVTVHWGELQFTGGSYSTLGELQYTGGSYSILGELQYTEGSYSILRGVTVHWGELQYTLPHASVRSTTHDVLSQVTAQLPSVVQAPHIHFVHELKIFPKAHLGTLLSSPCNLLFCLSYGGQEGVLCSPLLFTHSHSTNHTQPSDPSIYATVPAAGDPNLNVAVVLQGETGGRGSGWGRWVGQVGMINMGRVDGGMAGGWRRWVCYVGGWGGVHHTPPLTSAWLVSRYMLCEVWGMATVFWMPCRLPYTLPPTTMTEEGM